MVEEHVMCTDLSDIFRSSTDIRTYKAFRLLVESQQAYKAMFIYPEEPGIVALPALGEEKFLGKIENYTLKTRVTTSYVRTLGGLKRHEWAKTGYTRKRDAELYKDQFVLQGAQLVVFANLDRRSHFVEERDEKGTLVHIYTNKALKTKLPSLSGPIEGFNALDLLAVQKHLHGVLIPLLHRGEIEKTETDPYVFKRSGDEMIAGFIDKKSIDCRVLRTIQPHHWLMAGYDTDEKIAEFVTKHNLNPRSPVSYVALDPSKFMIMNDAGQVLMTRALPTKTGVFRCDA